VWLTESQYRRVTLTKKPRGASKKKLETLAQFFAGYTQEQIQAVLAQQEHEHEN
jgi:hypothetical protein